MYITDVKKRSRDMLTPHIMFNPIILPYGKYHIELTLRYLNETYEVKDALQEWNFMV